MDGLEQRKGTLYQLVDSLPPECLDAAESLLKELHHGAPLAVKDGKRIVRLGGLWKDLGVDITDDDIAQARKELWGNIGDVAR